MKSGKVIDLRAGRRPEPERPRHEPPAPRRERTSPLRARRRKVRIIFSIIVLLLVALLIYGVHWVSYLPRLTVNSISVEGAQKIDPALLEKYAGSIIDNGSYHFFSRSNMFLYPKSLIEKDIVASFPVIESARVARNGILGQHLTITVSERQPFAQWCTALDHSDCYAIDEHGYIFEIASSTDSLRYAETYVFTGGLATGTPAIIGSTFAPGHIPGLLALMHLLAQNQDYTPTSLSVESDQDFQITFAQGFILKASYGESPDTLARNLQLVLTSNALAGKISELEYIDLRFGNRVYYKLKGQNQVQQ